MRIREHSNTRALNTSGLHKFRDFLSRGGASKGVTDVCSTVKNYTSVKFMPAAAERNPTPVSHLFQSAWKTFLWHLWLRRGLSRCAHERATMSLVACGRIKTLSLADVPSRDDAILTWVGADPVCRITLRSGGFCEVRIDPFYNKKLSYRQQIARQVRTQSNNSK